MMNEVSFQAFHNVGLSLINPMHDIIIARPIDLSNNLDNKNEKNIEMIDTKQAESQCNPTETLSILTSPPSDNDIIIQNSPDVQSHNHEQCCVIM